MRRLLVVLALLGLVGGLNWAPPAPVRAAAPKNEIRDAQVRYHFGEEIRFQAQIETAGEIQEAYLSIQAEGEQTILNRLEPDNQGSIDYTHDVRQNPLRPFTRVYYWFRVLLEDGEEFTSPSFYFDYEDNRFAWQTLENGDLSVYWYEGDTFFGQDVLNTAHQALQSSQSIIPIPPPAPLKVYVYASAAELQSALQLGGQALVAGYANPDLGAVMVSVAPGPEEKLEMERQIPHELAHILIYQATGANYSRLPAWLVEGMASSAELYINPDYERAIQMAKDKEALLPMASLCGSFPSDAPGNFLAYAQSASFTRYLNKHYGTSGLQALLQVYANGVGCDEGTRAAFDAPLQVLETRWRQESLGMDPGAAAFEALLPYLVLLVVLLGVPLGLTLFHRPVPRGEPSRPVSTGG